MWKFFRLHIPSDHHAFVYSLIYLNMSIFLPFDLFDLFPPLSHSFWPVHRCKQTSTISTSMFFKLSFHPQLDINETQIQILSKTFTLLELKLKHLFMTSIPSWSCLHYNLYNFSAKTKYIWSSAIICVIIFRPQNDTLIHRIFKDFDVITHMRSSLYWLSFTWSNSLNFSHEILQSH